MSPQILVRNPPNRVAAAAYVGPGDVVSGAFAWYGVRGYNAAYATGSNPAVDLVDQAGANPLTVNILATGALDVASISAWVTANSVSTIKVTKLYDHTVNARHLVMATLANMPSMTLATLGTRPVIVFASSGSQRLVSSNQNPTAPFSMSMVYNRTGVPAGSSDPFGFGGAGFFLSGNSANQLALFASSSSGMQTISDNNPHGVQAVFASASAAAMYIDGGSITGLNIGTVAVSGQPIRMGGPPSFGAYHDGYFAEAGIWDNTTFTGTQAGNLNTNQHAYYGF